MHSLLRNKLLVITYLMTFLYALHHAIPIYATSSYLHTFFSTSSVTAIYIGASFSALFLSLLLAKTIRKFHVYRFALAMTVLEILSVILFGITENKVLLPILFIIHFTVQTLLYVSLNVFIESFSAHAKIGSIRGLFLAILNLGILISPLIAGTILTFFSFKILYIFSAILLIPYMYLTHHYLNHIKEPAYHSVDPFRALSRGWKDRNLKAALISMFVVECFYAVMIIYSPIYLTTLGIPLTVYLTIILPIALMPLVILPYELGLLADKKYGEKEMLIIGLLVLTVTTFLCVLITTPSLFIWSAVLFISRIGASFVETMAFSYYFKKNESDDPSLTSLFVSMRSLSIVVVGIVCFIASPFLIERPQLIFIILGCAILYSITFVLPMKDTR